MTLFPCSKPPPHSRLSSLLLQSSQTPSEAFRLHFFCRLSTFYSARYTIVSINMGSQFLACFLFTFMLPSFAASIVSTIRAVGDNGHMSTNAVTAIAIGIVVLVSIPLLWYIYKMCHRTRPNPTPLFAQPPPTYTTNATPNRTHSSTTRSSSVHITWPQKAHPKVNVPTSGV